MFDFESYKRHYKVLITLGIPIVIGQIGFIALGFADTFMVGHHSTEELAASSFVTTIISLAILISIGFSYGLIPLVGSLYGQKKYEQIGQVVRYGFYANLLVTLLLLLALGVVYRFVDRMGQPEELLPLIRTFFVYQAASLFFVGLFNVFRQFADGITNTKISMWILLSANVINILLNYIFIFGHWGAPEMGLEGAGLATLIARMLMVVAAVLLFFGSRNFAVYRKGLKIRASDLSLFRKINKLGWPIGAQMGMEMASFTFVGIMVGWLGTIEMAAHQVMITVSTICFMAYYGLGSAVAVRVSNFEGQSDYTQVRRVTYAGFHLMMLLAFVTSSIVYFFQKELGGLFTDSQEVILMFSTLITPMLLYQFGDGLQVCYANALRGRGDVNIMMGIAFIAYFVVSLPASYFFGFVLGWGVSGVWMGFPFGLTTAGILYFWRFYSTTNKMIKH